MRLSRTLARHLLGEILQYTALGFVAFATLVLTQNLLRRLDDLVAVGFLFEDVARVLGTLLPMLAAYIVPVAFLFGVLLTLGRMSADSEVTVMRACGLGIDALLTPILALGILVAAGTAFLLHDTEPRARMALRDVLRSVAARGAILEPGKFRVIGDRVVFVRERERDNRLRGILVSDRSDPRRPFFVLAEEGSFVVDEHETVIRLHLEHGDLHVEPDRSGDERYQRISFDRFDYAFDASAMLEAGSRELRPSDMTDAQLRSVLARAAAGDPLADLRERAPVEYALQLHRRSALPFAPILFALVAVPLGLRRARGARSTGAMLCVAIAFSYYAILSLAQLLARNQIVPPALALWLPNLAFALLAIPLLRRAQRGET
jgi:lipopolysaccharide export system permease protein